jgi:glycosyltransferase involved in cell wall biosynthesis
MHNTSPHGARVTVVVTSYNQEHWIEQALDSVAEQTERSVQLIVTDDGSTDGSCERIQRWLAEHDVPGELVASEHNIGLPAMLNRALPLFRGQYVVVLNGDDWMAPDRLELQAAALDGAPAGVGLVYSDLRVVDADGVPTGEIYPDSSVERREGAVLRHIIAHPMVGMPSVMVRRDVFDRIGPWDERLIADDYDFLLRVAAAGFEFMYLPALIINYRQYGSSLTGGRAPALAEGRIQALRKLVGRDRETDRAIFRRMEGLVVSLHGGGYDRQRTRAHVRYVVRRAPSRRLVRVLVENQLGLRPGQISPRALRARVRRWARRDR